MHGSQATPGTISLKQVLIIGATAALLLGSANPGWSANAGKARKASPSLHGSWVLDREKSDDAGQIIRAAREKASESSMQGGSGGGSGGGPGGGPGGPGGGPGGPGGGSGGPGGGSGGERGTPPDMAGNSGDSKNGPGQVQGKGGQPESPQLARLMKTPQKLELRGDDKALEVVEDGGTPGIIRIGNAQEAKGGTASVLGTARWQGRKLVSVAPSRGGSKVTDTYQLSKDGARLTITTKVSGDGTQIPNVKIRRIYQRAGGE